MCRTAIAAGALRFGAPTIHAGDYQWFHPTCAAAYWPDVVMLLVEQVDDPATLAAVRAVAAGLAVREVPLDGAVEAARRGDWSEVVGVLLDAWWSTRDRRVGDLISRLTADEAERRGGIPTGRELAGFVGALDLSDPIERGLYILATGRATKGVMPDQLGAGAAGPPDPRWADLLLPWLADPPWQNAGRVWSEALLILGRLVDDRLATAIEPLRRMRRLELHGRFGHDGSVEMSHWLEDHDEAWLAERMAEVYDLTDAQLAALDAIETIAARRRSSRDDLDARRRELYRAAAGGDDAALLVLADLLLAEGDLRGELVQLVMSGADRAQRARVRELEQKHWRALLGPLGAVVRKRDLVLRRGLPVEVVASSRKPHDIEAAVTAVEWASVERLELPPPAGDLEGIVQLVSPEAVRLREIRAVLGPASTIALLCEGPAMPSVRRIVIDPVARAPVVRFTRATRFPNLEEIFLPAEWPPEVRRAFREGLPGVSIELHQP